MQMHRNWIESNNKNHMESDMQFLKGGGVWIMIDPVRKKEDVNAPRFHQCKDTFNWYIKYQWHMAEI